MSRKKYGEYAFFPVRITDDIKLWYEKKGGTRGEAYSVNNVLTSF